MRAPRTSSVDRLLGSPQRAGTLEDAAATLLRSAANRKPPSPAALARVQQRLAYRITSPSPMAPPRLRWKTIIALVALSVGIGGVTAAGVWVAMPQLRNGRPITSAAPFEALRKLRSRVRGVRPPSPRPEALPDTRPATGVGADPPTEVPSVVSASAVSPSGNEQRPLLGPVAGGGPSSAPVTTHAPTPTAVPPRRFPSRIAPPVVAAAAASEARPSAPVAAAPLPTEPPPIPPPETRVVAIADPATHPVNPAAPTPPTSRGHAAPYWLEATPPALPGIAQEARLLGLALRSLRRDHDPRAALAALDEHTLRFPNSALTLEADVTRVDALLALDRRPAALAVLERMRIPTTARGLELTLLRGELRAGAKRCAEATADFTRLLEANPAAAVAERALYGRAACHLASGNQTLARADLRDYLARFPTGRFATAVRHASRDLE